MLAIKKLYKRYGNLTIFEDFECSFPKNSITCILGPSGCGKTTLLNMISGLEAFDSGDFSGFDNQRTSCIFQETRLLSWFTAFENITFVLKDEHSQSDAYKIAQKYMDIMELDSFKDYYPNQLSGGMKQRISIARAFAYKSDILLMDEPFKGLDLKLKRNLISAFNNLWKNDNRTVIFVTHEVEEALMIADKIIILSEFPSKIMGTFAIYKPREERSLKDIDLINLRVDLENLLDSSL